MDYNIGASIILGLVIATSIYVWNNNKFSKEQKIALLICFIFPPAQWLFILIVIAYNSNKEKNAIERKLENKLDSTFSNLMQLKAKGILTEEEYKEKIEMLENQNMELQLNNSIEHSQLKNLLESGLFTEDEFNLKIDTFNTSFLEEKKKVSMKSKEKLTETIKLSRSEIENDGFSISNKQIKIIVIIGFITIMFLLIIGQK